MIINMKKILLLSMCFMAMLISCSNDDDQDEGLSYNNIAGHWQSIYFESYDYETNELKSAGPNTALDFTLYDDGTCLWGSQKGTYNIIGEKLTISIENNISEYTIKEHNSDEMKISMLFGIKKGTQSNQPGKTNEYWWEDEVWVYTMKRIK